MKFRTEIFFSPSDRKIEANDAIFSIGSCFAVEIAEKIKTGQIKCLVNPFGRLFNPFSVKNCIEKISIEKNYSIDDLIEFREEFISFDHHSCFNSSSPDETLNKINAEIKRAKKFLEKSQWIIITYGSSFVYKFMPENKRVGNCHKIPQKYFKKELLSSEEIKNEIKSTIVLLKNILPSPAQILFTVSPVRHTKDGITENSLSKALLISSLHEIISQEENCCYLPVYETLIDDLRDYRFYKEDLIHPTSTAVEYIWDKFLQAYFSEECIQFIKENFKIYQAMNHRPRNSQHPDYLKLQATIKEKITEQQKKVKHNIFKND